MNVKSHLLFAFVFMLGVESAYGACSPGPLLEEVYFEFTVKSPTESGGCLIDFSNPSPTLGDILNRKTISMCTSDSYIAFIDSASLNVRKNCTFLLKATSDGLNITATGKLNSSTQTGSGSITISNDGKRKRGKFKLEVTSGNQLFGRSYELKAKSREFSRKMLGSNSEN